jgi:hypothetical protein
MPLTHVGPTLAGARRRVALATLACLVLAACNTADPAALTAPAVTMGSTTAAFVGDGLQHGPAGSPTYLVARDGATAVTLPDGNTLDLYSDTATSAGVTPVWFFTNSAALSPAGSPRVTKELIVNGMPTPVLPWTDAEAAQVVPGVRYPGVWPTGGTWIPSGVAGGNRALITYHRILTDLSTTPVTFTTLGQGVAEYRYTTSTDALTNGIRATRLNDDLFPADNRVSMVSPVYAKGFVYLYGCDPTTVTCFSARVAPDQVAVAASWQWWDGSAYAAVRANRRPINVGEFSEPRVRWLAPYGAYAMVNARGGDQVAIRWSSTPSGPWTDAQIVTLPGCGPTMYDGGCYLPEIRPESTSTSMVLAYARAGEAETRIAALAVQKA